MRDTVASAHPVTLTLKDHFKLVFILGSPETGHN